MHRQEPDKNSQIHIIKFNSSSITGFNRIKAIDYKKNYEKRKWIKPSFSITKLGPCVLDEDDK